MNGKNLPLEFEEINKQMYRISRTRQNTKKRWIDILEQYGGKNIQIVHTLKADLKREARFRPLAVSEIKGKAIIIIPTVFAWVLLVDGLTNFPKALPLLLSGVILSSLTTGYFFNVMSKFLRHLRKPAKNMKKIGDNVLMCLKKFGYITSKKAVCKVKTTSFEGMKTYETELWYSTAYENNLFIDCMREIYDRVENPRYLIIHESKNGKSKVYFNVPSILADNKEKAEYYHKLWKAQMGKCRLEYTRTANGRKLLLKARKGSFDYSDKFSHIHQAVKDHRWR
jgi:hypothetical protein